MRCQAVTYHDPRPFAYRSRIPEIVNEAREFEFK